MNMVLEARHLKKTYSRQKNTQTEALRDVSVSIGRGQIVGLVGESGCGKSTLARALARLTGVEAGEIYLNGRDITKLRGRALRDVYGQIQMVFQAPEASFHPRKTLGGSICEGMRNAGLGKRESRERGIVLLSLCGLPADFMNRYPHEVSGGECQRAAIARALASDPSLLICDEITSALDVTVQAQIVDLLRSLREQRGVSCLFISHDLALVQSLCDYVLVMYEGRIVEEGVPNAVIRTPGTVYTQRLIDSVL